MTLKNTITCAEALALILDRVDYTSNPPSCLLNEMVGAVLPSGVITLCREALVFNEESIAERAHKLAETLSENATITPLLTDDLAKLVVTLDEALILTAFNEVRQEALAEMHSALEVVNSFADSWHSRYLRLVSKL